MDVWEVGEQRIKEVSVLLFLNRLEYKKNIKNLLAVSRQDIQQFN